MIEQNNAPLISVALPVYNGEKYLAEAINSILSQTFANFELIIIDDGSTDRSIQVLRDFEKRDARIRLIARENRNLSTTLNDIIHLARGKWIARMDQDDIAMPQRFEHQLLWLQKNNADICGSWIKLFGTADTRILKHALTDEGIKMELLFGAPFAHPTVMMKKELAQQLLYDKTWEKCEDYDLWERAARANWKMTNVPEVLLKYRQHGAQISTSTFNKQQELTQAVRLRYWQYTFDAMKLDRTLAAEVIKLREPSPPKFDMDKIDLAFFELLDRSFGEAREIIFDHMTRLYFRAAAYCPDTIVRWNRLNHRFGIGPAWGVKLKLLALSILRIRPNSAIFTRLKSYYLNWTRST